MPSYESYHTPLATTYIIVNKNIIAANERDNTRNPPITINRPGQPTILTSSILIEGTVRIQYNHDEPLTINDCESCAKVYMQTRGKVSYLVDEKEEEE